jgi:hypothetical protein
MVAEASASVSQPFDKVAEASARVSQPFDRVAEGRGRAWEGAGWIGSACHGMPGVRATVLGMGTSVPHVRSDQPRPVRDARLRLRSAALCSRLSSVGVHDQDVLLTLEACVGGLSFGEGYWQVSLGLRWAFHSWRRDGRIEIPEPPHGRPLLRWGLEGDMHYLVTDSGEVWTQDGIADRRPHRRAPDPITFAELLNWPIVVDLDPLIEVLSAYGDRSGGDVFE